MTLVIICHGNLLPRMGIDLVPLHSMLVINAKRRRSHRSATSIDCTQVISAMLYTVYLYFPTGLAKLCLTLSLSSAPWLACLFLPVFGVNVMKHSPTLLMIKGRSSCGSGLASNSLTGSFLSYATQLTVLVIILDEF